MLKARELFWRIRMTKLKKKQYTIKRWMRMEGVFITYVTGPFEKTVYFTQLEHEIQFVDLLKEAGYTYVDLTPCDATT